MPLADRDSGDPLEKAEVAGCLFFRALKHGEYALAAAFQRDLLALGWSLKKKPPPSPPRKPRPRRAATKGTTS